MKVLHNFEHGVVLLDTTLNVEFTYPEALQLYENYFHNGWLNPRHQVSNQFYRLCFDFIRRFERAALPEDVMLECPACQTVNLKSEWLTNNRRCPDVACGQWFRNILGEEQ